MDNFNIIQNDDANTAKVIDAKVKNKWSWSWLEKKIVLDKGTCRVWAIYRVSTINL